MSSIRRYLGRGFAGISLGMLPLTIYAFSFQPDALAALTVLPICVWGGFGLVGATVATYLLRNRSGFYLMLSWLLALAVGSEEVAFYFKKDPAPPLPGPALAHEGKPVLRVLTLNGALFSYGDPTADLVKWQPDIVLLQDVFPYHVRQIAQSLYGGQGDFRTHDTNGIVTRWKIQHDIPNPLQRDHMARIVMPDGSPLDVMNVHLRSAATNLRLWRATTWREHYWNRHLRRKELQTTLAILARHSDIQQTPILLGGDFNSAASDVVHRLLKPDFQDAFAMAGCGGGNTYQRRLPILRIDALYANRHLTPLRSKVVTTRHSDHRMVVADFLMRKPAEK
jgi:endonuclease/exonuclease/phosphatase (EEP) superfamily protein YafD